MCPRSDYKVLSGFKINLLEACSFMVAPSLRYALSIHLYRLWSCVPNLKYLILAALIQILAKP